MIKYEIYGESEVIEINIMTNRSNIGSVSCDDNNNNDNNNVLFSLKTFLPEDMGFQH